MDPRAAEEITQPKPPASQYQALLEVTEFIATHRDLPELFHDLSEHLPHLVNFDALWLVLHEPIRNVMRLHIVETPSKAYIDVIERSLEDSPSGWVWQQQVPLVVADLDHDMRFVKAMGLLQGYGVKSTCILPLTTAHRRLGAVGFGSRRIAGPHGEEGVEFLQLVARQIAVAVDNTLNYQAAQALQQQLQHERDRLKLLLDLNNSVVSILDLRQLFRAISASIRQVMECDYASILLPESGGDQLRVYARDFSAGGESWQEEIVVPAAGRPAGDALKSGEPLLLNRLSVSHIFCWTRGVGIL